MVTLRSSRALVALSALSLILTACAANSPEAMKVDDAEEKLQQALLNHQRQARTPVNNVRYVKGRIMAVRTKERPNGVPFPEGKLIGVNNPAPMELREILSLLRRQLSPIRVTVTADLTRFRQMPTQGDGQTNVNTLQLMPMEVPPEEFIPRVADHFGLDWYFDGGELKFFDKVLHVYDVVGPIGGSNSQQNLSTASQGSSSGGEDSFGAQNDFTITNENKFDWWADLEESLGSMLPDKKDFSVLKASGVVTVTGTRAQHRQVSNLLNQLNAKAERSLTVLITILSVQRSTNDSAGFQLDGILNSVGNGRFDFRATGPVLPSVGSGPALSAAVVDDGFAAGSQFFIDALKSRGKLINVKRQQVTLMNYDMLPVQATRTKGFVSGRKASLSGASAGLGLSELQTEDLQTGYSMHLTTRIMDGGKARLRYALSIKSPPEFETFGDEGSQVQLKDYYERAFMQTVDIRSGETLIASALEQSDTQYSDNNGLFGMNQTSSDAKDYVVVIIEATVNDPYANGHAVAVR